MDFGDRENVSLAVYLRVIWRNSNLLYLNADVGVCAIV